MKKTYFSLFIFILVAVVASILESCDGPNIQSKVSTAKYGNAGVDITIYNIGGHEYIGRLNGGNTDWATHSGSCPHPDHKNRIDTVYVSVPADTVYCVISPLGTTMLNKLK